MAPIIGITGSGISELPVKTKLHDAFYSIPTLYVDCVQRAGGVPVVLPPVAGDAGALLDRLDGIVFSGGADLHPRHYNGNLSHKELQNSDEARDDFELELMAALTLRPTMPVLAICRGAQVMNAALGGTILEHLPDHIKEDIHRSEDGGWTRHDVDVLPDSKLCQAMGAARVHTVSGHHQALGKVASGLRVVARSKDDVIEAVEHETRPWCLAVQWHPERSAISDQSQQNLFDELVRQASA